MVCRLSLATIKLRQSLTVGGCDFRKSKHGGSQACDVSCKGGMFCLKIRNLPQRKQLASGAGIRTRLSSIQGLTVAQAGPSRRKRTVMYDRKQTMLPSKAQSMPHSRAKPWPILAKAVLAPQWNIQGGNWLSTTSVFSGPHCHSLRRGRVVP